VTLTQARLARLGEISRRDRGWVFGVFAQARATRLGENTRFPIYSHMQQSRKKSITIQSYTQLHS